LDIVRIIRAICARCARAPHISTYSGTNTGIYGYLEAILPHFRGYFALFQGKLCLYSGTLWGSISCHLCARAHAHYIQGPSKSSCTCAVSIKFRDVDDGRLGFDQNQDD